MHFEHIYSHLDDKQKQEKIMKTQGIDILTHHLKNTIT